MDVEAFIPPVESPRSTELAIKTCHTCLEAGACRDFAVRAGPYLFGVWGGTTSSERARLRSSRLWSPSPSRPRSARATRSC